ncbi:MAG: methylated-DNA--[protein]-cysteine S-methyltransferase [Bacteroidales bacterium]
MINIQYFKTPFGELILGSFEDRLCLCDWRYRKMRSSIDKRIRQTLQTDFLEHGSQLTDLTILQLTEYFSGDRREFTIPLLFVGSDFQKNVWSRLLDISYGKTMTYLALSKSLGNEKAIRAVAAANGANAISILVPCHRITGSQGEMVGYAGGIDIKRKLLELENGIKNNQLSLF